MIELTKESFYRNVIKINELLRSLVNLNEKYAQPMKIGNITFDLFTGNIDIFEHMRDKFSDFLTEDKRVIKEYSHLLPSVNIIVKIDGREGFEHFIHGNAHYFIRWDFIGIIIQSEKYSLMAYPKLTAVENDKVISLRKAYPLNAFLRIYFSTLVRDKSAYLLHGASFFKDNSGILVLGREKHGKSELSLKTADERKDIIVGSDDLSLVYHDGEKYILTGTPFCGTGGISSNTSAPLKKIYCLSSGSSEERFDWTCLLRHSVIYAPSKAINDHYLKGVCEIAGNFEIEKFPGKDLFS